MERIGATVCKIKRGLEYRAYCVFHFACYIMLCWSYTEAYLVKEALVAIRSLLQDKDVSTSAFGWQILQKTFHCGSVWSWSCFTDLYGPLLSINCVCCTLRINAMSPISTGLDLQESASYLEIVLRQRPACVHAPASPSLLKATQQTPDQITTRIRPAIQCLLLGQHRADLCCDRSKITESGVCTRNCCLGASLCE